MFKWASEESGVFKKFQGVSSRFQGGFRGIAEGTQEVFRGIPGGFESISYGF